MNPVQGFNFQNAYFLNAKLKMNYERRPWATPLLKRRVFKDSSEIKLQSKLDEARVIARRDDAAEITRIDDLSGVRIDTFA